MSQYAKFIVAALGVLAQLLNYALPLIPDKYKAVASLLLGALAALGVYQVRNAPAKVGAKT